MSRPWPDPVRPEDFTGPIIDQYVGIFSGAEESNPNFFNDLIAKRGCSFAVYDAGDDLFYQGSFTDDLPVFVVMSGLFAVKHLYGDKTIVVAFDACPNIIGDVEFYLRDVPAELMARGEGAGEARTSNAAKATVTALTESKVLVLQGAAREFVMTSPAVSRNMGRLFSLKLLRRTARGDALHLLEKFEQVAVLFKRISHSPELGGVGMMHRDESPDGKTWLEGYNKKLACTIRHEDLADALCVSTVTINTIYKTLKDKGWVEYQKGGHIYFSDTFLNPELKIVKYNLWW